MNGYEVGEYIQHKSGAQKFVYSDAIPLSISLPLTQKHHTGDSVYNYFDNLLPPDSLDIRNRIQARFGIKTNKPFDLLAQIGRDCVGAIQLMSEKKAVDVKKIEGTPLSEKDIADELRNYKTLPLGMSNDQDFRISLAGVQEKTAMLWYANQWQRPLGATPTTHIFRLPIGKVEHANIDLTDSVENAALRCDICLSSRPKTSTRISGLEDGHGLTRQKHTL